MTIPTSNIPSPPSAPFGPAIHSTPTHLFFYGYELQLPQSRLQNWYPASFTDEDRYPGIRFQTAEHYIMYRKALAMNDEDSASQILVAPTPAEANFLGRQVKGYQSRLWRGMVSDVAEECCWLKFTQVRECKEALLATEGKVLVEANPADAIWGIGLRGDEAVGRERDWGTNILGEALVRVRERLRTSDKSATRFRD